MLWLPRRSLKCFGFRGFASDLTGGTYSAPSDPLAEISSILFEIVTEMLREKQSELVALNFRLRSRIIYAYNCIMHGMLF